MSAAVPAMCVRSLHLDVTANASIKPSGTQVGSVSTAESTDFCFHCQENSNITVTHEYQIELTLYWL